MSSLNHNPAVVAGLCAVLALSPNVALAAEANAGQAQAQSADAAVSTPADGEAQQPADPETPEEPETGTETSTSGQDDAGETATTQEDASTQDATAQAATTQDATTTAAPIQQGTTYTVGTEDELAQALQQISASEENDVTIVLTASIASSDYTGFAGVAGKHVTVTSADGTQQILQLAACLEGDITLDNVCARLAWEQHDGAPNGWYALYACGHAFETTTNFLLYNYVDSFLFGGGPKGTDVTGDTSLTLRGHADWGYVYGGGEDSAVSGSTNLLVDDVDATIGNIYGGGYACTTHSGTVGGDVHLTVRQGTTRQLFGGGQNIATNDSDDRTPATVSGTVYVTTGYDGAQGHVANICQAMASYGGSWHSTVGNVRFSMLDGTWDENGRELHGCGLRDVVLGTVEISVDISDDGLNNAMICGGGNGGGKDSSNGSIQVLNQGGEQDAVVISYNAQEGHGGPVHDIWAGCDSSNVDMEVRGSAVINVENGNLYEVGVKSGDDGDESDAAFTATGGGRINVTGGRIEALEGLGSHYASNDGPKDSVTFSGCGSADAPTQIGYLYQFENVNVTDGACVDIDTSQFEDDPNDRPFYSVNNVTIENDSQLTASGSIMKIYRNLDVQEGSSLTTGGGQAWVFGDAKIDGTWNQAYAAAQNEYDLYVAGTAEVGLEGLLVSLGTADFEDEVTNAGTMALMNPSYMQADYVGDDGTLCLPVVEDNYDGTDDGGTIPLYINGVADGDSFVKIVSADDYTQLAMPALGQNYIVQEQTSPAKRRNFHLWNQDALAASLFLDNAADEAEGSSGWEWQIADGISVVFDLNDGGPAYDPWAIESEEHHEGETLTFDEPDDPTRDGYTFEGWNTERDGSGDTFTDETPVGRSMRVYAQWKKTGGSDNPEPSTPDNPQPTTPGDEGGTSDGQQGTGSDQQGTAAGNEQQASASQQQEKAVPQTGDTMAPAWLAGIVGLLGVAALTLARLARKLH